jgi:hypothetical protein
LFDLYLYDPLCSGKQVPVCSFIVDCGAAVHAQTPAGIKIDEQQANLRIIENVAQTHEGVVAIKIGEGEGSRIENAHQAGTPALEGAIAVAVPVTGGEKKEGGGLEASMKLDWDLAPK